MRPFNSRLWTKAKYELRERSTREFISKGAKFGYNRAVRKSKSVLPNELRRQLEYTKCEFETEVGTFSTQVPEGSYFMRRAPEPYEPQVIDAMSLLLNPEEIFYDIGAFFGYYVNIAELLGIEPQNIHAFEGDRFRSHILRTNHDAEGVNINTAFVGNDSKGNKYITIDEYAQSHSYPSVLKIDIEGGELAALKGMETVLEESHPSLLIEVHPTTYEYEETDLIDYLDGHGYALASAHHQVLKVDSKEPFQRLTKAEIAQFHEAREETPEKPYMLLAVGVEAALESALLKLSKNRNERNRQNDTDFCGNYT